MLQAGVRIDTGLKYIILFIVPWTFRYILYCSGLSNSECTLLFLLTHFAILSYRCCFQNVLQVFHEFCAWFMQSSQLKCYILFAPTRNPVMAYALLIWSILAPVPLLQTFHKPTSAPWQPPPFLHRKLFCFLLSIFCEICKIASIHAYEWLHFQHLLFRIHQLYWKMSDLDFSRISVVNGITSLVPQHGWILESDWSEGAD